MFLTGPAGMTGHTGHRPWVNERWVRNGANWYTPIFCCWITGTLCKFHLGFGKIPRHVADWPGIGNGVWERSIHAANIFPTQGKWSRPAWNHCKVQVMRRLLHLYRHPNVEVILKRYGLNARLVCAYINEGQLPRIWKWSKRWQPHFLSNNIQDVVVFNHCTPGVHNRHTLSPSFTSSI